MNSLLRLFVCGALLVPAGAARADLPDPADAWTEHASASGAQAGGWFTTCGLSQLLVVEGDCVCGSTSVGCRATQARWQNRFGLQTSADLGEVVAVRFQHKATWTGLDVLPWNLFLTMEVTPAEAAAGWDLKQLHFVFDKAETWTQVELDFAQGTWQWRDESSGMWQSNAAGGNQDLTTLVSLEWYINTFMGIAVGDEMLIDDLTLVEDPTAGPTLLPAGPALRIFPNPCKSMATVACRPVEAGEARLLVYDPRGRLVRELGSGFLPANWTEFAWDGRDAQGRAVAAGVYRVVLRSDDESAQATVTLVR